MPEPLYRCEWGIKVEGTGGGPPTTFSPNTLLERDPVPFEVKCESCGAKFRAADKLVGKRVKCPKCQAVILVGAGKQEDAPPKAQAASKPAPSKKKVAVAKPIEEEPSKDVAEWHAQLGEGEEYGPVTKSELDSWVTEGRLDGTCQVLKDGWEQWKWADDVFPELAEGGAAAGGGTKAEAENPFAGIGAEAPAASDENPFVSPGEAAGPAVAVTAAGTADGGAAVTQKIRRALADTKPWVTFLAILGFILGGLASIGPVIVLVTALFAGWILGLLLAVVMAVAPALYLVVAYYLMSYGLRIGDMLRSGAVQDLEAAMVAQKSFWKLIGIVTAVVLVLYLVMVMMMFALGGFASMALQRSAGM